MKISINKKQDSRAHIVVPNKGDSKKRFVTTINLKDEIFQGESLRHPGTKEEFYYSNNIVLWTEKLYYLFKKINEKNELIFEIIDLLSLAREKATPSIVKDLSDKLDLFLSKKKKYSFSF